MIVSAASAALAAPAAGAPTGGASAAGAAFRVPDRGGTAPPAARAGSAAGTARAASVGSALLMFQESAGDEREDQHAAERARALLDALRDLQRALLSAGGADAAARLRALAELPDTGRDPKLRALLRSISLRARIELLRAAPSP